MRIHSRSATAIAIAKSRQTQFSFVRLFCLVLFYFLFSFVILLHDQYTKHTNTQPNIKCTKLYLGSGMKSNQEWNELSLSSEEREANEKQT